jgi:glucosamine-6-phosphate deaminase
VELVVRDSKQSVAQEAANRITALIRSSPSSHLGLATGATQQGVYRLLIEAHREGLVNFRDVRFFMLDEYVGVPPTSTTSFQHVLINDFLSHVGAEPTALECLEGNAQDLSAEAERFDAALRDAGGVDLQLLGIGTNGHIGFNEPGSAFGSRTRVVDLHPDTVQSNAHYFDSLSSVPATAISQGIGTIMEARSILLLATGESKASAVASMVEGPVSSDCPASILQRHPQATLIMDPAAASLLHRDTAIDSRASV